MNSPALELKVFGVTLHTRQSESHDYMSLHPRFLELMEVIPDDWIGEGFQHSPGFTLIEYKNEVRLFGSTDALNFAEYRNLELGRESEIPNLIQAYVASMAPDVFQKTEMFWVVEFPVEDISEWLTERFFSPNSFSEEWKNIQILPTIRFKLKDQLLSFDFSAAEESGRIRINCGISTSSLSNDDELFGYLSNYFEQQSCVFSALDSLMEVKNGAAG